MVKRFKFESGGLIPDDGQWYKFCEITGIAPDSSFRVGSVFSDKSSKINIFPYAKFNFGKYKKSSLKISIC